MEKAISTRGLKALIGGAGEDRTHDLLTASQALSQLSYSPTGDNCTRCSNLSQGDTDSSAIGNVRLPLSGKPLSCLHPCQQSALGIHIECGETSSLLAGGRGSEVRILVPAVVIRSRARIGGILHPPIQL
jgi:hypothetical protein